MVKMRMTTADVAAEVCCLRKLIGMRCANIYDLTPRTYVIKLAKSSGVAESGESERALLLLESGIRLHTTEFARDKSSTPSGFTLKLRKHIRTRRLEDVRQLGIDRVVDFQFGLGEGAHHIILELYAQGNLLLTDGDYNVLTLLRTHRDDEKGLMMMTRHRYPIDSCRLFMQTSAETIQLAIQSSFSEQEVEDPTAEDIPRGKKGDVKGTLKALLVRALGYGPALTEHIILSGGLQPNMKTSLFDQKGLEEEQLRRLLGAIGRFENWLDNVVKGAIVPEGYIYLKRKDRGKKKQSSTLDEDDESVKLYEEFSPVPLEQLADRESLKLETFDGAMDEFFSKIEGQRSEQQRRSQEDGAMSKLQKIRADQASRVEVLKQEVDQSVRMAELIEYNLEEVDSAIVAVRSALASGMDWKHLAKMVKDEKKAGNPVAGLIDGLQLDKNQITLLLSNNLDDMDEDEKTRPADKVEVDLALSAHANARKWFEMKKKHAVKQEKTVAAHEKAFRAAERKTQQQLAQAKSVAAISHLRKVHWFEKFNWFISSENYLVISGRDAQQNELVVKRYMKKGDIYVHAELHGAASTVIKNHDPSRPIPPLTINQAGSFTVCRSQAWDSKIVTSAWWVHEHQVSKAAPTGEYLTVGSFMVRGAKNFLPPNPLVMGFGLLFRIDESCLGAHLNERRVRGEAEEENEDEDKDSFDAENSGRIYSVEIRRKMLQSEGSEGIYAIDLSGGSEDLEDATGDGGDSRSDDNGSSSRAIEEVTATVTNGSDSSENPEQTDKNTGQPFKDMGEDNTKKSSALDDLLDRALELRAAPKPPNYPSKYGLESVDFAHQSESVVSDPVQKSVQRERPYMSKAERRRLKKVGSLGGEGGGEDDLASKELEKPGGDNDLEGLSELEKGDEDSSVSGRDQAGTDGIGKAIRGKKGKLKKMKEKYNDQDEEDRQIRMSLLASAGGREDKSGTGGGKKDRLKSLQGRKEHGGSDRKGQSVQEDLKICYKCKQVGHVARDCPSSLDDKSVSAVEAVESLKDALGENRIVPTKGSQHEDGESGVKGVGGLRRKARAKVAEEEIAAIRAEENLIELSEEQRLRLTELDTLTGTPNSEDILLYAVPVCGPYNALQGYKFRVKLTPGAAKKGKGAKTALDVFSHMPETTAREKELMKAMTDPELAAAMIGNVKVTAPGLTKMKQSQKKGKKVTRH